MVWGGVCQVVRKIYCFIFNYAREGKDKFCKLLVCNGMGVHSVARPHHQFQSLILLLSK